ncbi:hypothetical protein EC973_009138 [Apophysomyces ossiformis]|uniref:Uncharacterized protein n=1 Tax=Apophysomyces ossiformis TaxID=679940 RepID=A0A8H7BRJ1_9FUNG|nr:hypothetical protein EC973_009138 [Apophysomyces ossiformis]
MRLHEYKQLLRLNYFESDAYIFQDTTRYTPTESDYLCIIWGPIMRYLFKNTDLQVKCGESVSISSKNSNKRQKFSTATPGYKVDVRIIAHIGSDQYDVAMVEMKRYQEKGQIKKDRTKLILEAKQMLDDVVACNPSDDDIKDLAILNMQIVG